MAPLAALLRDQLDYDGHAVRARRPGRHERDSVLTFGVAEQLLSVRDERVVVDGRSNTSVRVSVRDRPTGRCLFMLRVGYRIRLSSGRGPDREGVVTALVGSMLRVRWPSQEETIVIPGPGTLTVLASTGGDAPSAVPPGQPTPKKAAAKKAAPNETVPKKAAPKKAVAKATPKKAAARKAAPTKKKVATPKTASAKTKAPTKTGARKATGKSGSETPTGAKRRGR